MKKDAARKDVVLVVDDSPETLGMLNDTLEQAGVTVLVALEGSQALTIAHSITPDIILLDALMPGMDGFETCRRLKANPDLKVWSRASMPAASTISPSPSRATNSSPACGSI